MARLTVFSLSLFLPIVVTDSFSSLYPPTPSRCHCRGSLASKINSRCSQIVVKFHEAFYSMFNHFLVLSAELLENFLVCNECSSPIGFSHRPQCMSAATAALSKQSIWRKTKYDDKFITFGMKFSFYDIVSSEYRHNIIRKSIERACWKQQHQLQHEQHASSTRRKESQQFIPKNWPSLWIRDDSDQQLLRDRAKKRTKSRPSSYPETIATSDNANFQPLPLFLVNRWTPHTDDGELLTASRFIVNTRDAHDEVDSVSKE